MRTNVWLAEGEAKKHAIVTYYQRLTSFNWQRLSKVAIDRFHILTLIKASTDKMSKITKIAALLLILGFGLLLRSYVISLNLPYFYDEDEAHHFNRTVNMVKNHDLDPHYFHKPSLHFYLRMPVVLISYWWNKHEGDIENLNDIRTHNKFGIAEYAFTASHPGIVKWNRAFSVALGIIILVLTYLIAQHVSANSIVALGATLCCAVSPPLISYAGVIGVDIPMTMMVLASLYFSLLYCENGATKWLLASTIFAGLATSCKYNAAPIAAVPLISCMLNAKLDRRTFTLCVLVPIVSFFAASPYILVSLPLFFKQVGYEVWHYAVAGHEGNSASRGFGQIEFYSRWFYTEAVGPASATLALLGVILIAAERKIKGIVFLCFPLLFFTLMTMQKANFVRNMLVMIPFLSIAFAFLVYRYLSNLNFSKAFTNSCAVLLILAATLPSLSLALAQREAAISVRDSRNELTAWFLSNNLPSKETALAGQLLAAREVYSPPNVSVLDAKRSSMLDLYVKGYDRVICGVNPRFAALDSEKYSKLLFKAEGDESEQRIVKNPALFVAEFVPTPQLLENAVRAVDECQFCQLRFKQATSTNYRCAAYNQAENYCWSESRIAKIFLPGISSLFTTKSFLNIEMEVKSPWPDNNLFILGSRNQFVEPLVGKGSDWSTLSFKISKDDLQSDESLIIYSKVTASPFRRGLNEDKRRLGWAIREIKISDINSQG